MNIIITMPKLELFDRELVLNRILQVFWKKGYHHTSMQDIVEASGLGRSSIYNSFGSKREIFMIVLNKYRYEMKSNIVEKMALNPNPLCAIESILLWNLDVARSDKDKKGCFIVNTRTEMSNTDEHIEGWIKEDQNETLELFQMLVQKGQEDDIITSAFNKSSIAMLLYNVMIGLRTSAMTINNYKQLAQVVEITIQSLKKSQ